MTGLIQKKEGSVPQGAESKKTSGKKNSMTLEDAKKLGIAFEASVAKRNQEIERLKKELGEKNEILRTARLLIEERDKTLKDFAVQKKADHKQKSLLLKDLREALSHITRLKEENNELKKLSMIDALTKIPNRRACDKASLVEFSKTARQGGEISLGMIDVDYFKQYNDNYGHLAGDEILWLVADVLRRTLRIGDFIGRWGGEEFFFILPNTGETGSQIVAEKLRIAVEELTLEHEHSKVADIITVSLGVATIAPRRDNICSVLKKVMARADENLYEAKQCGRNRVYSD